MCSSPSSSIFPHTPKKPRIWGKSGQCGMVGASRLLVCFVDTDYFHGWGERASTESKAGRDSPSHESHSSKCPDDQLPYAAHLQRNSKRDMVCGGFYPLDGPTGSRLPYPRPPRVIGPLPTALGRLVGAEKKAVSGGCGSAHWLLTAGSNGGSGRRHHERVVVLRVACGSLSNHTHGAKNFGE